MKKPSIKGFVPVMALLAITLSACDNTETEPPQNSFRGFVVPAHFPDPVYDFSTNPVTPVGFELGRKLFYDVRLSSDGTISCGSCHAQVHAFADHNTAVSTGVQGRLGNRNAPAIFNLAWTPAFMWDGGINHIEVMPIAPFTDHNEMDMELSAIVDFLNSDDDYRKMFRTAFANGAVDTKNLLLALAQFQGSIVSAGSKYDKYILGEINLSAKELEGLTLFETHCSGCHSGVLFTDFSYRNNGLDSQFSDHGRARITLSQADEGKFRVPSLRNVRLTNPYMHDGRFATLIQVLDHYAEGVQYSPTLDPKLQEGIPLSIAEREAIIEFLITLNDFEMISDATYSEPLK
jgi:cytochrome c peroxidase